MVGRYILSDHAWGPSKHKGDIVQAVMLASWKVPGKCKGCGKPIFAGVYYMKHKAGGIWHTDCHFDSPAKIRPKKVGAVRPRLKKVGKTKGFFM